MKCSNCGKGERSVDIEVVDTIWEDEVPMCTECLEEYGQCDVCKKYDEDQELKSYHAGFGQVEWLCRECQP